MTTIKDVYLRLEDRGNMKNGDIQELAVCYLPATDGFTPKLSIELTINTAAKSSVFNQIRSFRTDKPFYAAKIGLACIQTFLKLLESEPDKDTADLLLNEFVMELKGVFDNGNRRFEGV